MRQTGSGVYTRPVPVPKMPTGLIELMEGLTRDVLKHNPPNVYEFCANHMQQLLLIRDGREPKRHLALENKIRRAQEKVRQKAEERRRKYDEEMKNLGIQITPQTSENNEVSHIFDVKKPETYESVEDNEANGTKFVEIKLKVPVHHEQDLADALEVEIFHKPVIDADDSSKMMADKITTTLDEIKAQDSKESNEINTESSENSLPDENQVINKDSTLSDTNSIMDDNKSSSVEDIIENDKEHMSPEHIRARRSVDLEEKEQKEILTVEETGVNSISKQSLDVETDSIVENENDINTEVCVKQSDTESVEETVRDPISNEQLDNELIKHTVKDTMINVQFDTESVKEISMDTIIYKPNEKILDSDVNVSKKNNDVTSEEEQGIVVATEGTINSNTAEIKPCNVNETVEKVDDVILKDDLPNVAEFSKHNSESQIDESISPIGHVHMNEQEVTEPSAEYLTRLDVASNVIDKDETDGTENDSQEGNSVVETEIKTTQDVGSVLLTNEMTEADILNSNDKLQSNVENKPSEAMKVAEYLVTGNTEKIESKDSADEISITTENETVTMSKDPSNNESNGANDSHLSHIAEKESTPTDNDNSVLEVNNDGAITTVDKVLIQESAFIQDDNESIPELYTIEPNVYNINGENINGTHFNNESILGNGSESLEPQISTNNEELIPEVLIQELVKDSIKVEDIPVQEILPITSEPKKVDDDTDSAEKTSSIDDSITDETIDSILKVDTSKSKSDLSLNKDISSSMDLETAAVTIQKVFRSFLFKRGSTYDDASIDESNMMEEDNDDKVQVEFPVSTPPLNKERRTLGISRMDTVLQTVNEEKSLSLSTDDSSLSSAATIIQAHVRGFIVRNRMNSNKTNSMSLVNSDGPSTSLEVDPEQKPSKTVLNIHIVPEGEHFLSRDESLLTSIDLSLDGSPPSSINLHPLGYDKSEPRKQLKREDAIQSISPPSNNSGKLSEDVDSVKDMLMTDSEQQKNIDAVTHEARQDPDLDCDDTPTRSTTIETVIETHKNIREITQSPEPDKEQRLEYGVTHKNSMIKLSSDESDVVTPYEDKSSNNSDDTLGLLHSGEFHDIVLPTKVSRSATTVVREFKNVLVYFLLWNNS